MIYEEVGRVLKLVLPPHVHLILTVKVVGA